MVVLLVVAVLAVTTPTSPVYVSYVNSDSMEPTIGVNDGYLVVADAAVERGDIAVFWSDEREEYVTHRVVDRTDAGLVTKGDNNEVTDQAAGYAHVQRADVIGTVLTVGGKPIIIPWLGVLASVIVANRLSVLVLGGCLVVGSLLYDRENRSRPSRSLVRVGDVTHPLLVATVVVVVGGVLLGAVSYDTTYVVTDGAANGANTLTVGEAATERVQIHVAAVPFTYRMIDTKGLSMTDRTANASTISAVLRIPKQTERGTHETSLTVYRYPAVLPEQAVRTIHGTSPLLAAATTVGLLFAPALLVYTLLFDGKKPLRPFRVRRRSRRRNQRR